MTESAYDILRAAAALVRRGWAQGALARDAAGRECDPDRMRAVAWDLVGALYAAASALGLGTFELVVAAAKVGVELAWRGELAALGWAPLRSWNDAPERTADEVAALLDRAAELAWSRSAAVGVEGGAR